MSPIAATIWLSAEVCLLMEPGKADSSRSELRALRHEILGQMNTITLSAALLDESIDPPEAREWIDLIEQTADKVLVLLEKLESLPEWGVTSPPQ
jgi:hypothetical protein